MIDLNSHIDDGSYKSLYMHQMVSDGSAKSKRSSSPAQDDSKSKSRRITEPTSAAMPGGKLHDKLPGSGGRQDEAEDDDSDVDSESEYTSSDVDADDEDEGDDEPEEIWQAIPSELIPDQVPPSRKRKVVQSEALPPTKRYKRTPRAGIQKRTGSTRRKRTSRRAFPGNEGLSIYSKHQRDATLICVNSWRKRIVDMVTLLQSDL